jgi:drug/metabolite transporter (DMT)-like permease
MSALQSAANTRGVLFMLGAMAGFAGSDFLVKLATQRMPLGEIMALRGVMSISLTLLLLARGGGSVAIAFRTPTALLRGAFEAGVSLTIMAGLASLPLGDCAAIPQTAPLIITLYMIATGAERFDLLRILLILGGFAGVALIAKPSGQFQPETLYLIAAAFLVAGRDLTTRRIPRHVTSLATGLVTTCATTLFGFTLAAARPWVMPDAASLALLAGSAVAITIGYLCSIAAFRDADPSVVAPFRYTIVIYALAIGFAVFGDVPAPLQALGIALIATTGVLSILRERARARIEKPATGRP